MKIAILSCTTGGGHNAAAAALAEELGTDISGIRILSLKKLDN